MHPVPVDLHAPQTRINDGWRLTAWADESGSRPDLDPGAYLLAATLCDDDDVAEMRKTLDALRIGEAKLHWHGSSAERRVELVAAVAGLPVTGFVVVHVDKDADDRRHRRKCMEFLLPHLALMPCSTITFESRGQLDASDLDMLQKLRARKVIESTVRIEHSIGRNEPALWAADIVCGAVVQGPDRQPDLSRHAGKRGRTAHDLTRGDLDTSGSLQNARSWP